MQFILALALVAALAAGAAGVGMGAFKAVSEQTKINVAVHKLSTRDVQGEELERIQQDTRTAPLKVAGAIAESAMAAQSIAAPGVSPNPVGLGVGEGMTFAQLAIQAGDEIGDSSAGTDGGANSEGAQSGEAQANGSAVGGSSASDDSLALLGSGVDLATAPDDYYVGWYVVRDGERWLRITTVADYRRPQTLWQIFQSDEDDETPVRKVPVTNADWSDNGVAFALDEATSGERKDSSEWYAELDGHTYRCTFAYQLTDRWQQW